MAGGKLSGLKAVRGSVAFGCFMLVSITGHGAALAGSAPEIRITAANQVPACVTPDRLMAFLKVRNRNLDPRFKDIASFYKQSGEAWRVRWDYAFFQMAIETNFLTYRRPEGQWGDVNPRQNNFAGIGTTGGGVPGDKFPDVKTGVLGQIQHLVAYSGERMAAPTAPRTQLKQDDIILESQKLGRPVRFSDLARRWAVDPRYGSSIEWVADAFRSEQCKDADLKQATGNEVLPWATGAAKPVPVAKPAVKRVKDQAVSAVATGVPAIVKAPVAARTVWVSSPRGQEQQPESKTPLTTSGVAVTEVASASASGPPAAGAGPAPTAMLQTAVNEGPGVAPSGLGAKPLLQGKALPCRITSASYGGKKTVLIKAAIDGEDRYTALTVLDGFEKSMTDTFLKTRAPGGEMLGEFTTKSAAVARAHELCPQP